MLETAIGRCGGFDALAARDGQNYVAEVEIFFFPYSAPAPVGNAGALAAEDPSPAPQPVREPASLAKRRPGLEFVDSRTS
jgi:hypothetical protein